MSLCKASATLAILSVVVAQALVTQASAARPPVSTVFTFQGFATQGGIAVSDDCDFIFKLFTEAAGGLQVGPTLTHDGVGGNPAPIQVVNGVFAAELDFGAGVFDGDQRFLEVTIRCPSVVGSYTTLPRVALNASPYAQFALDSPPDFGLPLSVTIDNPQDALSLTNNGGGVYTAVTSQDGSIAVKGIHTGDGSAGKFENTNAANTSPVLDVAGNSTGPGIRSRVNGAGNSAAFEVTGPLSSEDVVTISGNGGGDGLSSVATGNGRAGYFEVSNPLSTGTEALNVLTNSNGRAARFEVSNANSTAAEAVKSLTKGTGRAGLFEINTNVPATNSKPALEATTNGLGVGIRGFSPKADGVFGQTDSAGTFALADGALPARIIAGVHGTASGLAATGDNFGVAGTSDGYGSGVLGIGDLGGYGVVGVSGTEENDQANPGVWGMTREGFNGAATWPPHFPIDGSAAVKKKVGVLGQAYNRVGVWGESINNVGVAGTAGEAFNSGVLPTTGPIGVFGSAQQISGIAGYFDIPLSANFKPALFAKTVGVGAAGEFEAAATSGVPVAGLKVTSTGVAPACQFITTSATNTRDVLTASTSGTGSVGFFQVSNTASNAPALIVQTNGQSRAGEFRILNPNAPGPPTNTSDALAALADNNRHALFAQQTGPGEAAHFEIADPGNTNNAVLIKNNGGGIALSVENNNGGFAALAIAARGKSSFNGQVDIIGNLIVDGNATVSTGTFCAATICAQNKNFRIDHPLDPENKFLQHACVESNEMKTVYDGTAVLDDRGESVIVLPEWFEALNRDYRYQLTCVGRHAPVYISQELENGSFRIGGGISGLKVCWQITGTRQDAFAVANPLIVELEKEELTRIR